MVFESIVTDILNRFIGDYVENLDRKQLKIGIWGGKCQSSNKMLENKFSQIFDELLRILLLKECCLHLRLLIKNSKLN